MYDFGDTAMMEALRPSIEEAFPIQSQVPRALLLNRLQLLLSIRSCLGVVSFGGYIIISGPGRRRWLWTTLASAATSSA